MNYRILRLLCLCSVMIAAAYSVSFAGLDPGFGNDGRVAVELGVYGDRANAVAVQPDGKIIVAGSSSSASDKDFMLFRLLADGSLDPDFNFDGTVTTAVGSFDDEILALALQEDGKIIAAGYSSNGSDRDFALARYYSDGTLDRNFGLEGLVVTAVGNSDDEITGIAVQEDGAVVVTGTADGTAGRVIVLGRYRADGSLDTGFADSGFSFTGVGKEAQAESVALLEGQRIVVAGSYSDGESVGLMVVGFRPDGQLDEGFADNGIATPADSRRVSEGYGMHIRNDGSIVVAGSVGEEGKRDAALFMFTATGNPVLEFEDKGVLVTPVSAEDDVLYDVVATDKKIAATGYTTTGSNREFLFITYEDSSVSFRQTAASRLDPQQGADLQISDLQVQGSFDEFSAGQPAAADTNVRISELQVAESFDGYQAEQQAADLLVDVITTEFGSGDDVATALAMVPSSGVVVVGVSRQSETTSAAVSKYTELVSPLDSGTAQARGSAFILTGQPFTVTRTSALVSSEVFAGIGAVTERGIVFSTVPNPSVGGGGSDSDPDNPGDTTGPLITNTTGATFTTSEAVTLTISTDEKATCKYNKGTDTAYGSMTNFFAGIGSTSHSKDIGSLAVGSYTYYARCVDSAGNESSSGTAIAFTVTTSGASMIFNKTMQLAGNLLVAPAFAQDATTTVPTVVTTTDTTSTTNSTGATNIFNPENEEFLEEGSLKEGSGTGVFTSKLENLKPGTFFYVRAYAIVDGTTYYGNQVGFRTSDSCFIATAAFGSIIHPSVKVLRDFRDRYMLDNQLGRFLVTQYYRYSPSAANVIAADDLLRFITRVVLLPLVGAAWLLLHAGIKALLLMAALTGLSWYLLRRECSAGCA